MDNETYIQIIPLDRLLEYVIEYKENTGKRNSWNEVARDIQNHGHRYSSLVTDKKLRNWAVGRTVPDNRFLAALQSFLLSEKFISTVPALPSERNEKEVAISKARKFSESRGYPRSFMLGRQESLSLFNRISGFWFIPAMFPPINNLNLARFDYGSYVLIDRVSGQDFLVFHMMNFKIINGNTNDDTEIFSGLIFIDKNHNFVFTYFSRNSKEDYYSEFSVEEVNSGMWEKIFPRSTWHQSSSINLTKINSDSKDTNSSTFLIKFLDESLRCNNEAVSDVISPLSAKRIFDKIYWDVACHL